MTSIQNAPVRCFMVAYESSSGLFEAYARRSESHQGVLTEVSPSLVGLLEKCKNAGLVFVGLCPSAIDRVHYWLTVEKPTDDYVQDLWEEFSPSKRGPIGFRAPSQPDVDANGSSE